MVFFMSITLKLFLHTFFIKMYKAISKTIEIPKWKDYLAFAKIRLSMSVVFSSIAGYILAADKLILSEMLLLSFGGIFVTGAANGFNQIIEKDKDKLMSRTQNRPLPSDRMGVVEALLVAGILTFAGLYMLYNLNPLSASFGAFAIVVYTLVYTPLKGITPFAVFVGAFPGAIPFMLGWVAASNQFGVEPGTLFAIQFMWQFPHFWAIAWMLHDDYLKAGYNLLPSGARNKASGYQIIMYSLGLIVVSILPAFGITGSLTLSPLAAILVVLLGIPMVKYSFTLYKTHEIPVAKKLMLMSIFYLTALQVIYCVDKWI